MSIKFPCSSCGVIIKAPDRKAGTIGTCPKCNRRIGIPNSPEEDDDSKSPSREPWYYGFLATYSKIVVFFCTLAGLLGVFVSALAFARAVNENDLTSPVPVLTFFIMLLILGILLGIIFFYALVLLAVDAARNLRTISRESRKR